MNNEVRALERRYREGVQKYGFIDANYWVDPYDLERLYPAQSEDEAVEQLERTGLAGALITHGFAASCSAAQGNEKLLRLLSPEKKRFGCAVLAPDPELCGGRLEEYLLRLIRAGVRAIRYFPKRNHHSLGDTVCGGQYELLERLCLPLVIRQSETSWDAVDSLCARHPALTVIIDGSAPKILYHNRDYLALLQEHGNLLLETHELVLGGEIEYICSRFGAKRLVFGSGACFNEPGIALSRIIFADISEEDKRLIAHGNIKRLMEAVTEE